MTRFNMIDLKQLPKPKVIKELDFETILAAKIANFKARHPDYDSAFLESDPAIKLLESAAYDELLLRQQMNERARAVMLAFAEDADLDHIGANYGVARRVLDAGDPEAVPPVPPTYEDDEPYRRRIQLAPEAMSVAGPRGGYIFNSLSAGEVAMDVRVASPAPGLVTVTYEFDPDGLAANVKDADAFKSAPGDVTVIVMGHEGDGVPDAATLDAVTAHLNDEYVRPLNDTVFVLPVEAINYVVDGVLEITDGPEAPIILAAANEAVALYTAERHKIGRRVTLTGLAAAATVPGVEKVRFNGPLADIEPTRYQTAFCTGINLTAEVVND